MEKVCRIFLFLLPLLFYSTASSAHKLENFFNCTNSTEFSPFEENGKFGLKNTNGDVLIPAEYDYLGWSNHSFSVIENVTGYRLRDQWGLINLSNQKITKAEFTDLSPGHGSILVARKKLTNSVSIKAGCITTSGKTVIPFIYDGVNISSLRAIVYERNGNQFRHGLIDLDNKVLIPLGHAMIYPLGSLRYGVVSFDNKTAIFSEEGKQLTGFVIDSISSFKKNYAIIYQDQRQGLINRDGAIVLQPAFREIAVDADGSVKTRMADTWQFLEGENKLTQQYNADSVRAVMPGLLLVKDAGVVRLMDNKLQPITHQSFSFIGPFRNGKAIFSKGEKKGVLRQNGSIVIAAAYDRLIIDDRYVRAQKLVGDRQRWVVLDTAGKTISDKHYDFIEAFNGKFFPVVNKGFYGAMDTSGKEVVACVHDSLLQFIDDHIVVKFMGQYGVINSREEWIITPKPNKIRLLGESLYLEVIRPNVFLKSIGGSVIYFTENPIDVKSDHLLEYQPSGTVIKVDFQGRIVDRFSQDGDIEEIFEESEGYRAIKRDGRYGFIDSRSRLRIANRYENVKNFSEGRAAARILGKWGFINKEDQIAVQPVYEEVFSFQYGFAIVRQKDQYGLIDKKGKLVLPVRYDSIVSLPSQRFLIRQNGLYGLADTDGQIVLNTKYESIEDPNNGYLIVGRDGKYGVVTVTGMSTIPMIYDAIRYDGFHNQYLALKRAGWESMKF
jgi:hypothetical protein